LFSNCLDHVFLFEVAKVRYIYYINRILFEQSDKTLANEENNPENSHCYMVLYRARHNFVNCFTVAVKLRKEFKIDKPEQAPRSSGYTIQVPSELRRSSIPCKLDAKELFKLALDSSPYGVV
jgi:hypothetical protein